MGRFALAEVLNNRAVVSCVQLLSCREGLHTKRQYRKMATASPISNGTTGNHPSLSSTAKLDCVFY